MEPSELEQGVVGWGNVYPHNLIAHCGWHCLAQLSEVLERCNQQIVVGGERVGVTYGMLKEHEIERNPSDGTQLAAKGLEILTVALNKQGPWRSLAVDLPSELAKSLQELNTIDPMLSCIADQLLSPLLPSEGVPWQSRDKRAASASHVNDATLLESLIGACGGIFIDVVALC